MCFSLVISLNGSPYWGICSKMPLADCRSIQRVIIEQLGEAQLRAIIPKNIHERDFHSVPFHFISGLTLGKAIENHQNINKRRFWLLQTWIVPLSSFFCVSERFGFVTQTIIIIIKLSKMCSKTQTERLDLMFAVANFSIKGHASSQGRDEHDSTQLIWRFRHGINVQCSCHQRGTLKISVILSEMQETDYT